MRREEHGEEAGDVERGESEFREIRHALRVFPDGRGAPGYGVCGANPISRKRLA